MITVPVAFEPKSEEVTNEFQMGDAADTTDARCESRDCRASHVATDTDTDIELTGDMTTDHGIS